MYTNHLQTPPPPILSSFLSFEIHELVLFYLKLAQKIRPRTSSKVAIIISNICLYRVKDNGAGKWLRYSYPAWIFFYFRMTNPPTINSDSSKASRQLHYWSFITTQVRYAQVFDVTSNCEGMNSRQRLETSSSYWKFVFIENYSEFSWRFEIKRNHVFSLTIFSRPNEVLMPGTMNSSGRPNLLSRTRKRTTSYQT